MMFSNSGNLGLPLATLAFGAEYLPLSVIAFVVSAALNHSLGVWYVSGQNPKGLLRNPVFLATGVGIACNLLDWQIPRLFLPGLEMLAQVAVPLLLVALGVRLTHIETEHWKLGVFAAILCPVLGLLLAWISIWLLRLDPYESQALILFGALPPAVMNFLMAERYGHFPHQVASIVAIGNLMALVTIPLVLIYLLHNSAGV
jgi:predicted permease